MPWIRPIALLLAAGPLLAAAAPAPLPIPIPTTTAPPGARLLQRYDATLQVHVNQSDVSGYVTLRLKALAKVWTLMGEPVVYCTASWSLLNTNLQASYRGEVKPLLSGELPKRVFDEISLVEATVGFPLYRKSQSFRETPQAWVPCDLGALNDNGDADGSFNMPGSPDWKRFLLGRERRNDRPWDDPAHFLSAADAKTLLASDQYEFRAAEGGRFNDDAALKFDFNFSSVRGWLAEQHAKKQAEALAQKRRLREEREAIVRRNRAASGAASAAASGSGSTEADPFEQMVAEVETTRVERETRADHEREDSTRQRLTRTRSDRKTALLRRSCGKAGAGSGADLEAAAERAEEMHALCASTEGVVAFSKGRLHGFKRPDGTVLIEPAFDYASNFADGLGRVKGGACAKGQWCFVNASGEIVVRYSGYHVDNFREGLAPAQPDERGRKGYIDRTGRAVIAPRFEFAYGFSDGLGRVSGGDCGSSEACYVDKDGRIVLSTDYPRAGDFHEGLASARGANMKYGFIDRNGRMVIEPRYWADSSFKDGRAPVRILNRTENTDRCGVTISHFTVGEISPTGAWLSGPDDRAVRNEFFCLSR